ncbi:MAG: topoisomerase DNA-binding C4 zinc finger domain-containing protein, partial [Armatimonadia bacterium]
NDDLETQLTEAKSEKPHELEGEVCPKCGGKLLIRYSLHGKFAGCEKYPECDYTRDLSPKIASAKEAAEPVGRECPDCGQPLLYRTGFRGSKFIACSGYPKCTYKEKLDAEGNPVRVVPPEPSGVLCEKCGAMMVIRISKRGPFLGCSKFPRCRSTMPIEKMHEAGKAAATADAETAPVAPPDDDTAPDVAEASSAPKPAAGGNGELNLACDKCGAPMVIRKSNRGPFVACSGYPACKNAKPMSAAYEAGYEKPAAQELEEKCPECGKTLLVRESKRGKFVGCSGYPKCKYARDFAESSKDE